MTIFNHMTAMARMPLVRIATIVRPDTSWSAGSSLGNKQQCGRGFAPGGAD